AHATATLVANVPRVTPRHLFKFWTNYDLPGPWFRWSVGGSLRAQSTARNDDSGCLGINARGICIAGEKNFVTAQKGYAVVSPRIGYRLGEHWQAAVSIDNLFDRRYYETVGTPDLGNWYGEPRNIMVRFDGSY